MTTAAEKCARSSAWGRASGRARMTRSADGKCAATAYAGRWSTRVTFQLSRAANSTSAPHPVRREHENPRRQRQRHHEQLPGRRISFDPTDLPVGGALRQRGAHARCLEGRRRAARCCAGRERQGADRQIRAPRPRSRRPIAVAAWGGERAGKMGKGLPVVLGTCAQQQDVHRAFAPQPQPPQQLVRLPQVVVHRARLAAQMTERACSRRFTPRGSRREEPE